MLLLIRELDDPLQDGFGGLRPVAMERTLKLLDEERRLVGDAAPPAQRPARSMILREPCRPR
jgi:hypothetical protein